MTHLLQTIPSLALDRSRLDEFWSRSPQAATIFSALTAEGKLLDPNFLCKASLFGLTNPIDKVLLPVDRIGRTSHGGEPPPSPLLI